MAAAELLLPIPEPLAEPLVLGELLLLLAPDEPLMPAELPPDPPGAEPDVEAEPDPEADPDAAVFSFGCPVA
ncbi:MAG TPA: hypothetical protein VFK79_04920 [Xanthobacteraceae bacterium]|nr:hypothetical protein [Xanthobacteraceae bacterium]